MSPEVALGEVATIVMGQSPPGSTYNTDGDGPPFFQGKAEFGEESPTAVKWCSAPQQIADTGDILLSVRAPVGPTNYAAERCCIGRGLAAIRAVEGKADTRFIRYFLRSFEATIAGRGVGSTFTAINRSDIEKIRLPLPPLPEQKRIVRILDEAEELRRLRAEADRRTTDLVPAIFYDMFGEPTANPRGWPVVQLGRVLDSIEFGISEPLSSGCEYQPDRIPVLRIANVTGQGEIDYSDLRYLKVSDRRRESLLLRRGDLLFNWRNSPKWIGKTAVFESEVPSIFASFLYCLRIDETAIERRFLWFYLNQLRRDGYFQSKCRQAVSQANFGRDELAAVSITLPPLLLQRTFAARVAEVRAMESEQVQSCRRLDDLSQALLHGVFGERP